jgi:aspartate/methionine/tyrosine aminotransferase
MKIELFEMERMQSTWENVVEIDLSESGVRAVTIRELIEMGFDLEGALDTPLSYSQGNGTVELRQLLSQHYAGATIDHIEVTNGTSEANFIVALTLIREGDEVAMQLPNYMQMWGLPRSLGAKINLFRLRSDQGWEIDWDEFDAAVTNKTSLLYLSHPNNPTGKVFSRAEMERIVRRCDETETWLVADEVYQGAELSGERTPSFWGMSDRVIITNGLSKAYGIPGIRIGWIVGPPAVIQQCWSQHDYTTICPNKLSDNFARTAVTSDNREKLFARTRSILSEQLPIVREWVGTFDGLLELGEPDAGAFCLINYKSDLPSQELADRIRINQSTLIVPGSQLRLESCFRLWFGATPDKLREGLRRIGTELRETL